jgi:hypothetical protein
MQGNSAGPHQAPVSKLLLHTTEGGTIEGACAAYDVNNSWPHLTVDATPGRPYRVCGHLGYDVAARSLKNVSGGVETNTAGVIQIEIVGFATRPSEVDWVWIGRNLVGPIARECGIPLQSSVAWVAYPASYGGKAPQRLHGQDWLAYRGVLGHQHVPENEHGDPGLIPIELLLDAAAATIPEEDMPLSDTDLGKIEAIVARYTEGLKPLVIAGDEHPTNWYIENGVVKQEVDQNEAAQRVAEGTARWWPGQTQALVIPQAQVDALPTVGPDDPDV